MSNKVDLDALEKLWAATTPGEWWTQKYSNYTGWSIFAPNAGCIAERWYSTGQQDEIPRNDLFIAAAHNTLPALIDELRELRELVGLVTNLRTKDWEISKGRNHDSEERWLFAPYRSATVECNTLTEAIAAARKWEAENA